jgi:hypothetical protein
MALRLQFLTLVVQRARFARCRELPRFFSELHPEAGILFGTSWYDAHLWCETAMHGPDIDEAIRRWEAQGLAAKDAQGQWADLCLCAYQRGPLGPCPWLQVDLGQNAVWFAGTEPGRLVGGFDQVRDLEEALMRHEAAAEAAYAAMYDARHSKDDYEDARASLIQASETARFLHRVEDCARLETHLAHVQAVYEHQMKGF